MNKNRDKELQIAQIKGKTAIITALIGCIGVIIAAIIGIFSININIENNKLKKNNESLKSEKTELVAQSKQSEEEYNNLESMYYDLKSTNDDLIDRVNDLESDLSQYDLLVEENISLKDEVLDLKEQLRTLSNTSIGSDSNSEEILPSESGKKVSIFDLDTFKGEQYWFDRSYNFSDYDFIDTYGNEYLTARVTYHGTTDIANSSCPIYLLDNKYSLCQGQIAWPKSYKNYDGSVWIDFYSDNKLIYSTEPITSDSRVETFEFSIENIEKLTVVTNGSTNTGILIIYPYFNLIE